MTDCNNTNTNNGIPVGIGYDSRNRARSLMELSSIVIDSISATTYLNVPAVGGITYFSALNDVCASAPTYGQSLVWDTSCWAASTTTVTATVDPTTINHDLLANRGNDAAHTQYALTSTLSTYTPLTTTTSVSNTVNSHIASGNVHFTSGSLNLSQYALTSTVSPLLTSFNSHVASGDVHFTSGSLNLSQYALEANLTALSGYVSDNEGLWNSGGGGGNALSAEPYVTVVATGTLTNERVLTSTPTLTWAYTSNIVSATVEPSAIDHNSLANITVGNPHTQYGFASSLTTVSGDLDSHEASASVHFTVDSLNLGQYALDTNLATVSSLLDSVEASTISLSSYIGANESSWSSVALAPSTVFSEKGNPARTISSTTLTLAASANIPANTLSSKSYRMTIFGDIKQTNGDAQDVEVQVTLGGTDYLRSSSSFANDADRYGFKLIIDLISVADDTQFITIDFMSAAAENSTAGIGNYGSKSQDGFAYSSAGSEVEAGDLKLSCNMRFATGLTDSDIRIFHSRMEAIPV